MTPTTIFCQIRVLLTIILYLTDIGLAHTIPERCKDPVVRREWGNLNLEQRRDYIDAVLCLHSKPSKLPSGLVPGALNRADDFIATHINQSAAIHLSGIFLAWHRNFVWLWENALRDECGYQGYQPYWDWPLWQSRGNLSKSAIFDGSDTSFGGDGYPDPDYHGIVIDWSPNGTPIYLPKANGGGCMMNGPFVNLTANLGPIELHLPHANLPSNWTTHTPHCIRRDLNDVEAENLSYKWYNTALAAPTIQQFQHCINRVHGGLHTAGHYTVGPTLHEFFASPCDPVFLLHHGAIDRLWSQWQAIDQERRTYGHNALYGTSTMLDANTTPWVNFDTVVNWGYLGRAKTLRELMSPTAYDFCYIYDDQLNNTTQDAIEMNSPIGINIR